MNAELAPTPYGQTDVCLYPPGMARYVQKGIQRARRDLSTVVANADKKEAEATHTVLVKRSKQAAVVVSMEWFRRARAALGEPSFLEIDYDEDDEPDDA